ncbi:MAG: hypothetical protein K1X88_02595 [Nannocystaceae bacterium]|nr:hypothetical protein [Nannocystaceae bacterium]
MLLRAVPRVLLFAAVVAFAGGCADDEGYIAEALGEIDEAALRDGVTVELRGEIGSVAVPMLRPVPAADDRALEQALRRTTTLVVASVASGASADLATGSLVDGDPAGPGEFSWSLSGGRDQLTLRFFNAAPSGLTLGPGRAYQATLSVADNGYVERVPALAFDVTVEER